jgi:hypothetical protein
MSSMPREVAAGFAEGAAAGGAAILISPAAAFPFSFSLLPPGVSPLCSLRLVLAHRAARELPPPRWSLFLVAPCHASILLPCG